MLPTEEQYLTHLRKIGVGDSKPVICYDNGENRWAARTCFILQYWGFKNRIHLLTGGLELYTHKTVAGPSATPEDTSLKAKKNDQCNVDYQNLLKAMEQNVTVVDARPADAFVKGNIKNSISLPAKLFFNSDKTVKDELSMEAIFSEAGINIDKPCIFTCQFGAVSTIPYFIAVRLRPHVGHRMYDGGYAEYS